MSEIEDFLEDTEELDKGEENRRRWPDGSVADAIWRWMKERRSYFTIPSVVEALGVRREYVSDCLHFWLSEGKVRKLERVLYVPGIGKGLKLWEFVGSGKRPPWPDQTGFPLKRRGL